MADRCGHAENIICIKNLVRMIFHPHTTHHTHTHPSHVIQSERHSSFRTIVMDATMPAAFSHVYTHCPTASAAKNINFSNFFRSHDDKIEIPFNFFS